MSDDKAQTIVDQALESGSLEQRNTVAVVVGIAGSGKTWLISRIFRTNPPGRYTSTGIAEKSLRGLMHRIARMDSLELLAPEKILEFLAPFFQGGLPKADVTSLAKIFTEEEALEPAQASSEEALSHSQPTTAIPSSSTAPSTAAHSLPEKSYASEAMISLVQKVKGPKKALIIELLYMIDTGGQPEFMETMPSLIHNSNLTVLVMNLAQSLDEYPLIAFYEDGTAFKRPLPSALTNRQVIHQLACTLQAKRLTYTGSQQSKVSIIGTHRDCVKDKLSETLAAVNKELKSLFVPAMENELIVYRSCDEIIFPVNLLNPDDHDKEVLELIRQKIIDADIGEKVEIPASFFLFEQEAILYAKEKKEEGRQLMVLSFDECVQVGTRLKMSSEVVQAALIYFHRHNIFLYFKHVLPNLVFLSPQVPLDFVNAIVALSYKVKSGGLPAVLAKYERFCKEGIITEEMLCDKGLQLSHCFIPSIYEPQDAIKLFLRMYTIAQLSTEESLAKNQQPPTHSGRPGQKSSTMRKKEYLMMSLLAAVPEKDIQELLPSSSKAAPLVIHFSNGCVPNGCFCNITSCLISVYNWKLCRTEQTSPECLAHNIVKLCDPIFPVTITMVNYTRHLEIHVNMDKVEEKDVKTFCLNIRRKIFAAVDKVFDVMRFQRVQVEPAFLCPCECSPSHAARICPDSSYIVCSKTGKLLGSIQRKQQVWFQDGGIGTMFRYLLMYKFTINPHNGGATVCIFFLVLYKSNIAVCVAIGTIEKAFTHSQPYSKYKNHCWSMSMQLFHAKSLLETA